MEGYGPGLIWNSKTNCFLTHKNTMGLHISKSDKYQLTKRQVLANTSHFESDISIGICH